MAHTLGLVVVAEGVETAEQLTTLCHCKCDVIQGYLFSRPVQPLNALAILKSGRIEPATAHLPSVASLPVAHA
jgi:EAL domain-containing protein (putative c-di-GMP-specific phosphodiesterase class I)